MSDWLQSLRGGTGRVQTPAAHFRTEHKAAGPAHLEDFVEAVVLLHDLLFLRVQDGAADQQVEVLTGQTGPHHLGGSQSERGTD